MSIPEHLKNKRICLYTVILGHYDIMRDHVKQDIDCDYISFTDETHKSLIEKTDYEIRDINKNIIDVVLYRTNLFLVETLRKYDICIYIDGNAQIIKKDFIRKLLCEKNVNNYDMIISKHPDRNCIYDEAKLCLGIQKYQNTDLERQMNEYRNDNYPERNGLYWNGFIVYLNPFKDRMKPFYEMYTEHMIKYVKNPYVYYHPQGQVSLPYVLNKTNLKVKIIPKEYNGNNIRISAHTTYDFSNLLKGYNSDKKMDLRLVDSVTRFRNEGKMNEALNLSLAILKSYDLQIDSENLNHIRDYDREKLLNLYYSLSIILYYFQEYRSHVLKINEKLLYTRDTKLPSKNISENRRFIIPLLSDLTSVKNIPIGFNPPSIPETDKKFRTLNPSILSFKDHYYINVRCVNYNNDRCINFTAIDKSYNNKIVTRNFLIRLDSDFNTIWIKELINNSGLEMKRDLVQGLEDVHLFEFQDKIHFVCSTYYTSLNGVDMCHGIIDFKDETNDTIEITDIEILNYSKRTKCEKNWLPFVKNDSIHYLYSQEPLTILSNDLKKIIEKKSFINCENHRGSGGPLIYKDGYLITEHEVVWNGNGRTYMHKFVHYDKYFNLISVSPPFKFEKVDVDYCRSITYSLDKKEMLIGVGIEDRNFQIYSISVEKIEELLYSPIPYI